MMIADTLSGINDSTQAVKHQVTLWKINADSTADRQSITFPGNGIHRSFFTGNQLASPKHPDIGLFPKYQPDWILGILLFCFILLSWIQFFYPKRLRQILLAPFSKRHMSQLQREGDLFSDRISVGLALIFLLIFPLTGYQAYDLLASQKYEQHISGFTVYLIMMAILLVFWLFKISLMKFLGTIFRTTQSTDEYLMNSMLFNFMTGLVLLPLMVLVVYLKSAFVLKLCLVIIVLWLLLSFVKGFLIGFSMTKYSYVFLFVYLCSLEILPLVVLIKMFRLYF